MKKIFKQLKYIIIASLIFILLFFYFGVFNPLRNQLESSLRDNFEQLVSTSEINLKNYIKQCKEGAESLSSRTMIRNKLADYKARNSSLDSLKDYTGDKYNDGANALNNCLAAYRISDNQIIAESIREENFAIEQYYNLDTQTTQVDIFTELGILVVASPINHAGENLGYDVVSFDLTSIIEDINSGEIKYQIMTEEQINKALDNSNLISASRQILNTEYYLLAEMKQSQLYQNLNRLSLIIRVSIIIFLFLLAFLFKHVLTKSSQEAIAKLEGKNQKLKETNQRLETQLEKGKRIHRNLLPKNLLRFDKLEIATYYQAAEKIGADFHQIIDLKDKTILYLSDTTGHSIDGAFLNIFLRETIKNFFSKYDNANEAIPLDKLVKHIRYEYQQESFPDDYFISLMIFVIDKKKQKIKYVNAGIHIAPVLISGGRIHKLSVSGPPISNAIESEFYNLAEQKFSLREDSVLIATTDGLIEEEFGKEIYGQSRLKEVVKKNYQLHPEILLDKIINDLNNFTQKEDNFSDDITLLAVSNRKLIDKLFLTISSNFNEIESVKRKVDQFLEAYHNERIEIMIGLQELLMNAIEHGNKGINGAKVKIRVLVSENNIDIEIEDEGEYFNWRDKINKEIDPLDFTDRGRGLIIANKSVDYLAYNQLANKAIMHIKRK